VVERCWQGLLFIEVTAWALGSWGAVLFPRCCALLLDPHAAAVLAIFCYPIKIGEKGIKDVQAFYSINPISSIGGHIEIIKLNIERMGVLNTSL
jgi:hypothetical protein